MRSSFYFFLFTSKLFFIAFSSQGKDRNSSLPGQKAGFLCSERARVYVYIR